LSSSRSPPFISVHDYMYIRTLGACKSPSRPMNACLPVRSSKYIYKKKERKEKREKRKKERGKEKEENLAREDPENLFVHGIIEWKPIESTIVRPRYYNPCANNRRRKEPLISFIAWLG
jgi:hypothetical protein